MEDKNGRRHGCGRGRPAKKPDYDSETLMQDLLDAVTEVYQEKREIKATALELDLPPNKVKKLLITAGMVNYPETERIQRLLKVGKSMAEVGEELHLSNAAINTYLPYSKVIYKLADVSQNAERTKLYRNRQKVCSLLLEQPTKDNLWHSIDLFQGYPFYTAKRLKFIYTVKGGEIFVSRKEKSITRATVEIAFDKMLQLGSGVFPVKISGPKKLGVFGASYLYPVFIRLGLAEA